jgi:hypothetical protein
MGPQESVSSGGRTGAMGGKRHRERWVGEKLQNIVFNV